MLTDEKFWRPLPAGAAYTQFHIAAGIQTSKFSELCSHIKSCECGCYSQRDTMGTAADMERLLIR